nr:helix-turn-helix transcriptional regulator [Ligilactobacillus ruminis]
MILADKITEERKKKGWSQEELANQLGVSRQAVSKWESAGSIPDLQRILQMSELFGVSTDYLLKDELEEERIISNECFGVSSDPLKKVTMEEANIFLDMKRKGSKVVANATSMCILSPVLLIILGTMTENHMFHISESLSSSLGCVFLFGMIAAAFFMFITYGMRESHMEDLETDSFETEYGVSGMVREKRDTYEPTFIRNTAIGVVLCILSVIPLVIAGVMEAPDYICGISVGMLLIIIAVGVNLLIRTGMIKGSYDILLQEGEFSKEEKQLKKKTDTFSGVYWCLTTAIYLGWSFWSREWGFTWIIWPVAGVLFAALLGIFKMIIGKKK